MLPNPSQIIEWTVQRGGSNVECVRRLVPPGVIDLAVTFHGMLVASWMTTDPEKADAWVSTKRRAWEAVPADTSAVS